MKKAMKKRTLAGFLALTCTASAVPFAVSAAPSEPVIIYETGFEDGEILFTRRGEVETLEISTEDPYSGDQCLAITTREQGWNGPQFAISDLCEPGVKYVASVSAKAAWYNNVTLSIQYTDSEGNPHYSQLSSATSQGEWVQIPETTFSFSEDMSDVYLYVEANDKADIFIDDFCLKTAPVYDIEEDLPSLKEVYAPYFKIGGAVTVAELAPKSTKHLIEKHYNSITLGNELKPENVLDRDATLAYLDETGDNTTPQVHINAARSILNYCRDNDISVRGHVLVWHSQTPDWFFYDNYTTEGNLVDEKTMLKRMENYIKALMETLEKEYPTVDFYAWDVVNEAWTDAGMPRTAGAQGQSGSENSMWVKVFGDNSFIPYAFRYAREYAPKGCKLYYNDFNEYMDGKMNAIVKMASELKEEGIIDGIGMQSHLDVSFPTVAMYEKAVAAYTATGLDVQVTELDVTTADISEAGLKTQAQYYSDIMDALVKYADGISAVVFWGTTDDMSWRSSKSPLLFNEDYSAKPAFYSIVDGLDAPVLVKGDVNGDGKINAADVVTLQKYLLGIKKLSAAQMKRADMNEDGFVNVFDLSLLKKTVYLAK